MGLGRWAVGLGKPGNPPPGRCYVVCPPVLLLPTPPWRKREGGTISYLALEQMVCSVSKMAGLGSGGGKGRGGSGGELPFGYGRVSDSGGNEIVLEEFLVVDIS